MTLSDTIQSMPATSQPLPPSSRTVAGKAVKDLIAYAGLTVSQAGLRADNLSTPTVKRIIRGEENVGDAPLQAMAGVLNLPINLFLLIIAEDWKAIEKLSMNDHVKDYVMSLRGPSRPPVKRQGLAKG